MDGCSGPVLMAAADRTACPLLSGNEGRGKGGSKDLQFPTNQTKKKHIRSLTKDEDEDDRQKLHLAHNYFGLSDFRPSSITLP